MAVAPCPLCGKPVWSGEEHRCLVSDTIQPDHYHSGSIDVIYFLENFFPTDHKLTVKEGFFIGNVLKYTSRYKQKNGLEDLKKARFYLDKLIALEGE